MTEQEKEMLKEIHDYLFKPMVPGDPKSPTRATLIDRLFNRLAAGGFFGKAFVWILGAFITIGAAMVTLNQMRGNGG